MPRDYRARTFGDIEESMRILVSVRAQLPNTVYAVLGNHDSIDMVPVIEKMVIKLLLNENTVSEREGPSIVLACIDDADFFASTTSKKQRRPIPKIR
ncbi:MAG: transcriptional regulator CtsR [Gammaproteobacteria bacterium]|jgi:transcriptional regulator CtsR